jgi:hypothetical protein
MTLLTVAAVLSSLSFFVYVADYFRSPHMRNEFKRFGLEKLGLVVIILQLLGAIGLLVGLRYSIMLTLASLGLALLMFSGVVVRIISKDSLRSSLQALFFMGLNAYTCWASLAFWP